MGSSTKRIPGWQFRLRRDVIAYVEGHPGCSAKTIARALDTEAEWRRWAESTRYAYVCKALHILYSCFAVDFEWNRASKRWVKAGTETRLSGLDAAVDACLSGGLTKASVIGRVQARAAAYVEECPVAPPAVEDIIAQAVKEHATLVLTYDLGLETKVFWVEPERLLVAKKGQVLVAEDRADGARRSYYINKIKAAEPCPTPPA